MLLYNVQVQWRNSWWALLIIATEW